MKRMQIEIRKATIKDIDAVNQIYTHIHDEIEKGSVQIGWIRDIYPIRATAEDALARGNLFVEEWGGQIVGTAIINQIQVDIYKEAVWQYQVPDDQIMVLHTLVIDPYSKGHGFGTAFVKFYEQYALEHGCSYLRMDTNERNVNAREFYKKLNYKEIGILPCVFNGIPDVNLVMLEKKVGL